MELELSGDLIYEQTISRISSPDILLDAEIVGDLTSPCLNGRRWFRTAEPLDDKLNCHSQFSLAPLKLIAFRFCSGCSDFII